MKMKRQTITAFILGVLIVSTCSLGYFEYVLSLGFTDGYVTDYERKISSFYKIMTWPLFVLAGYSFYLCADSRKKCISKRLLLSIFILLALLFIFMLVNIDFHNQFDHGQGG